MEGGLRPCEGSIHRHWGMGGTFREEDGRVSRTNGAHRGGRRLLLFIILFGIDCQSAQVVFRHMVDGMDHFVGYLLGHLTYLLCS